MNSRTCFQGFFSASEPKKSLLLKSFCFYHVDFPGCEGEDVAGKGDAVNSCDSLTLEQASTQVGEAMKQLNIKKALGMGVGAGAYILCKAAIAFPASFSGLVLLSPCCRKATWWEYAFGKMLLNALWYHGKKTRCLHSTPNLIRPSDHHILFLDSSLAPRNHKQVGTQSLRIGICTRDYSAARSWKRMVTESLTFFTHSTRRCRRSTPRRSPGTCKRCFGGKTSCKR